MGPLRAPGSVLPPLPAWELQVSLGLWPRPWSLLPSSHDPLPVSVSPRGIFLLQVHQIGVGPALVAPSDPVTSAKTPSPCQTAAQVWAPQGWPSVNLEVPPAPRPEQYPTQQLVTIFRRFCSKGSWVRRPLSPGWAEVSRQPCGWMLRGPGSPPQSHRRGCGGVFR